MADAREHLAGDIFSYILLDLQIPVRYGRKSRISNGQNLLREIRSTKGYEAIPIIVMTTHGHDSPDLAIEVFRGDGASDFVKKPFPECGHTLEKSVREALDASGRSRPGAARRSGAVREEPLQPFEVGEMVFFKDRVELCEVKICGGLESGMIRRILDQLRHQKTAGRYVRYSGTELAKRVGCERGQNGVAEAVRSFRDHVCQEMAAEARVQINRLRDVILNDRRYGYRLSGKITVREGTLPAAGTGAPINDLQCQSHAPLNDSATPVDDPENNDRQCWALEHMRSEGQLRKAELIARFKCANKTAQRDLRDLRCRGLVEFVGPPKTGHWRLAR